MSSCSNSEKATKCNEFDCGRKCFLIIYALNLITSLSDKVSLVTFNSFIRFVLDFVDPFTADWFVFNG